MFGLPGILGTLSDLAMVVIGFSLIILIHELGHFVAARWAGIRVMAFALGFGPAACSYRRGWGLWRGSSEAEYLKQRAERGAAALAGVSPTEYRCNVLPLGGYVKMLGQDDSDPSAISSEPDSFQSAKVTKRMVVICAGVVCNIILSAALFAIVFTVGLRVEPPIIGEVGASSPAALVAAENARALGVSDVGLQPGDRILRVDGREIETFHRLMIETALSQGGRPIHLDVQRPGVPGTLHFAVIPTQDPTSRRLEIGVLPAVSGTVVGGGLRGSAAADVDRALAKVGLAGVGRGMGLVVIGTKQAEAGSLLSPYELTRALRESSGRPVPVEFAFVVTSNESGTRAAHAGGGGQAARWSGTITPLPDMQSAAFAVDQAVVTMPHLAGLTGVLRVGEVTDQGRASGLREGDIFARLGDLDFPSLAEGIAEVRRGERASVHVEVLRAPAGGAQPADIAEWSRVDLGEVKVRSGKIGFQPLETSAELALVARWPLLKRVLPNKADSSQASDAAENFRAPSGSRLELPPGTIIVAVDGHGVSSLLDLRERLRSLRPDDSGRATTTLTLRWPPAARGAAAHTSEAQLTLEPAERESLAALGWHAPFGPGLFEPEMFLQRGRNVFDAVAIGVRETRYAMLSTYLTLARLFQGTVKVEHLNGPVGIAHVGTLLADRGFMWLLFFMAVVSVNLAVVNFLPLPIVDGGQFLYLVYERITGKPVSVMVQNIAALAGMVLIGSAFLVVTFNDVARLLGK